MFNTCTWEIHRSIKNSKDRQHWAYKTFWMEETRRSMGYEISEVRMGES